jgi:hypothetical protein
VNSQNSGALGEGIVVGGEEAGIAEGAEVLGGEKTEGAAEAEGADRATGVAGTEGLGGVFDDGEFVRSGQGEDGVHVGGLAEKMNGDEGLRAGGDFPSGVGGIEVEASGTNVHKDRGSTGAGDATGRREESEGWDENFVTRADLEGHEGEKEGVGAGGNAEGVFDAEKLGEVLFEGGKFRPEDVVAGAQNALEGGDELGFEGEILTLEVK